MKLSVKTTILFSPDLHEHLVREARRRELSLGQLVREACEAQYGRISTEDRLQAIRDLSRLSLPVAEVERMKQQSVPSPRDLLP